jgi:hypothetical protein
LERGDQIRPTKEAKLQPAQTATTLELKLSPHKAHTDRSRASKQQKISRCSGYLLLNAGIISAKPMRVLFLSRTKANQSQPKATIFPIKTNQRRDIFSKTALIIIKNDAN